MDEFVEQAVDVLSDMVQFSTFPVKEMTKEKTVILEDIKRSEDYRTIWCRNISRAIRYSFQ